MRAIRVSETVCSSFVVTHFYMIMQECGSMFWAAERFSGTNCPGCEDNPDSPNVLDEGEYNPLDPFNEVQGVFAREGELHAYPNPTSGQIRLVPEGFRDQQLKLDIVNIYGAVVHSLKLDATIMEPTLLNLKELGLAAGLYYFHAYGKDQSAITKVTLSK